jgi:hypothetical protein
MTAEQVQVCYAYHDLRYAFASHQAWLKAQTMLLASLNEKCISELLRFSASHSANAAACVDQDDRQQTSGWRTPWNDSIKLGQGFQRTTGKTARGAIKFIELPDQRLTGTPTSVCDVITSSSEYSELVSAGKQLPCYLTICVCTR